MSRKHTAYTLILVLAVMLLLSACQTPAPATTEPAPTEEMTEAVPTMEPTEEAPAETVEAPKDLVFGMVLVGPKNDHGWSQAHYEAGQYVEEKVPGAKMIVFESLNSNDKPEATLEGVVADMVSQGATLIITTSDEFEEDTTTVAASHPDVTFINASGDDAWADRQDTAVSAPANLGNVMGRMEYTKAIAGCAAALATETGSIGYLGPLINFETHVVLSGIDTTEAIVVSGQRAEKGEKVFAIPYDYVGACDISPDVCLGTPFFNWGPAYLKIAQDIQAGTWEQSFVWLDPDWADMTNKDTSNVGWVDGPALTPEMKANLDGFIGNLSDGTVNVWTGPINLQDGTEYVAEGSVATDPQIWYLPQLLEGMTGASQ
jgi:simple sugar transport system substrate-binding protein